MFRRVATVCSHVPPAALACHFGSSYAFCVLATPLPALGDVAATRDSASAVAANQRNNPGICRAISRWYAAKLGDTAATEAEAETKNAF